MRPHTAVKSQQLTSMTVVHMSESSGEVKAVPLTQEIDKRMQEVARELKDEDLLDAAALLAARHSGLEGEASELRSWLALLSIRTQIAHQLGWRTSSCDR
jgi:hypothetical protein